MQPSAIIPIDALILKLKVQIGDNSILHQQPRDGTRDPADLQATRHPGIAKRTESIPDSGVLLRYVILPAHCEVYPGGVP